MKVVKIWLLAGIFCLFNCNFGMVEYTALHPQVAKAVQADSTQKPLAYAPNKEVSIVSETDKPTEKSDMSISLLIWSGIKYVTAMLLKIITSVI
jgi:hypothetical protein